MNHNGTINKQTSEDFFKKICISHFIVRVQKGLFKVLWLKGVGDRTELQYIDPHFYGCQRCVFLVLQGCSTGGPGAQLSAGWWLSLPHLINKFSGPQLNGGPMGPFSLVWLSLPHIVYNSVRSLTVWLLSWLSYKIVQRPLNLLNGMFDRHQVEITVMQFTAHSLPVYQSISVSRDFFTLSHFVSQARLHDFLS